MEAIKLEKGQKVIITHNPFDGKDAEDILAEIKQVLPNQGHMRTDMAELEYTNPITNEVKVFPFGICNFKEVSAKDLMDLANKYYSISKHYSNLAKTFYNELLC